MTDAELYSLALDIVNRKVFTTYHVPDQDQHLIPHIFLPLSLMDFLAKAAFIKDPPGLVYQYFDQKEDIGINGYPVFLSFERLSVDEWNRMVPMMKVVAEAMPRFAGALPASEATH